MFKKIFTIATLLCVIPMLANAATKWQLGTRAMSQGGVIDSRNMTGQTVANGGIFRQYTTATNSTVTVTPNAGFKISKISNNGLITVAPIAAPFTFAPDGTGNVTIQATFARVSFVLNAIAGSGGSVSKSSYPVVYTGIQSPAKTFIFTPNPGKAVTAITASAGALNVNFQYLNAVTGLPTGLGVVNERVKVSVVNVPSNITFSASFVGTATGGTTPPTGCVNCHATQGIGGGRDVGGVYYNWSSSDRATRVTSCAVCHVGADTGGHPGITGDNCIGCHAVPAPGHLGGVADNNFGVRSIVQEFSKWSHHVTGVNLNNAHCAACHLEGKVVNGVVVKDTTYHMADNKTHLRNADTDADMQWDPAAPNHSTMDTFCMSCHDSNGATSAGSVAIQAYINSTPGVKAVGKTASASNPFGDTISNRYDKMQRPAVTNVDSQFNTTNNSHHGVKGPRYSGRTRLAGARQIASPGTFANNSTALLQGARSTMYDAGNLNQLYTPLENTGGEAAPRTGAATLGDDSTLHCGDCHTVGQWKAGSSETANGSPTPVAIGAHGSNNEYLLRNSLGTDQRHTQNAFLQGNITGTVLNPVTGLPLANGEVYYTNPNGAFLVCYNCHNYNKYGSIYLGTGLNPAGVGQPHAGEYDAQGRCNGIGNTIPFNGYTTGTKTDGTQFASRFMGPVTKYSSAAPYAGEQDPDFGNILGIQCLNCHNSGIGNAYGGIHGSANNTSWNNGTTTIEPDASVTGGAYIDGMGNTNKVERFLPGLGNVMHVPGTLGGVTGGTNFTPAGTTYTIKTGGISNDTNWEQRQWQQQAGTVINNTTGVVTGGVSTGAGCYTLGATTVTGAAIITSDMSSGLEGPSVTGAGGPATEATDTWGGCDDHTAGQGKGNHGFLKRIIRPVTY